MSTQWLPEDLDLFAEIADRLRPHAAAIARAWAVQLLREIGSPLDGMGEALERLTEVNRWFLERHLATLGERDLQRVLDDNLEGDLALLRAQQTVEPELRSTLSQLHLSLEISARMILERIRALYRGDPRLPRVLILFSRLSLELAKIVGASYYEVRSEALRAALRSVSSLLEASYALNQSRGSVTALLLDLAGIVQRLVRCDKSLVLLWRETEQAYVAEAGLGLTEKEFAQIRRIRFRHGDPQLEEYAVAPIASSRDNPLGMLAAYRNERAPFDGTDLEIFRGVAQTAALAIEGAMLVQKLESDLAERRRVEAELAHARDAALEAVRLKSAFLANVSHEIRTPLNIIAGYNQMVADRFVEIGDDSQRSSLDAVQRASRRLIRTVQSILDMSKIDTATFETQPARLELAPIVEEITQDFQRAAQAKGLRISCEIAEPQAVVYFDEYCLSQALLNLFDNAIKFTEQGGITVRLARDGGGALCLEVRDTGVGIDEGYQSHLVERFSQEESGYSRRYEGSGLGLALVKHYVERNGARLGVESEKHKGSAFTIYFPDAIATAPDPQPITNRSSA
jgi:signal transduction histidine kinase